MGKKKTTKTKHSHAKLKQLTLISLGNFLISIERTCGLTVILKKKTLIKSKSRRVLSPIKVSFKNKKITDIWYRDEKKGHTSLLTFVFITSEYTAVTVFPMNLSFVRSFVFYFVCVCERENKVVRLYRYYVTTTLQHTEKKVIKCVKSGKDI